MIQASTKTGSGDNASKNYFTETVTIVKAVAHYCETQEWQKYPNDLGLTLTLDIGKDFQPEWYLGGSYRKNETTGEIDGWSTVWSSVGMLFRACGTPIECPKGQTAKSAELPQDFIDNLSGKTFCRLKYRSNKRTDKNGDPRWVEFNNTEKTGMDDMLVAKFLKDTQPASNGKVYVKDFLAPGTNEHPLAGKVEQVFAEPEKHVDVHEGLPT